MCPQEGLRQTHDEHTALQFPQWLQYQQTSAPSDPALPGAVRPGVAPWKLPSGSASGPVIRAAEQKLLSESAPGSVSLASVRKTSFTPESAPAAADTFSPENDDTCVNGLGDDISADSASEMPPGSLGAGRVGATRSRDVPKGKHCPQPPPPSPPVIALLLSPWCLGSSPGPYRSWFHERVRRG